MRSALRAVSAHAMASTALREPGPSVMSPSVEKTSIVAAAPKGRRSKRVMLLRPRTQFVQEMLKSVESL